MKNNYYGAPIVMRNRGKKTDSNVLEIIKKNPGLTIHEIATILGWTNGKVDGSVNRLAKSESIKIQYFMRRRKFVKKIFPFQEKPKPANIIEIPKDNIEPNLWKDEVCIYSLSRSSIGISPSAIDEWEQKAFWKGRICLSDEKETLKVELPSKLSDFYRLENSEIDLTTNEDFALITVEESIIPVDLQPSEIEEKSFHKTTDYFAIFGKIERTVNDLTSGHPSVESIFITSLGTDEIIPNVNLSESNTDVEITLGVERTFHSTEQELTQPKMRWV